MKKKRIAKRTTPSSKNRMGWALLSLFLGTVQYPQQRSRQSSIKAHQGKQEIARRLKQAQRNGNDNTRSAS